MAKFPRTESKVLELAKLVIDGLEEAQDLFPEPPVEPPKLGAAMQAFVEATTAATQAAATAKQRTKEKAQALATLTEMLKTDLRYAEIAVGGRHTSLMRLGWGARRPKTPLQPPGQALSLTIEREGPDWIELAWKKPADGGKPAAYRVQVRARKQGPWRDVGSTVEPTITLYNQERSTELNYRVLAVNRAGDGNPSNMVTAVL
jgi:hypothetical protein